MIDAATGEAQDLGQVPGDIAWSPDGRWLLFLTGSIELIPLERATGVSIATRDVAQSTEFRHRP